MRDGDQRGAVAFQRLEPPVAPPSGSIWCSGIWPRAEDAVASVRKVTLRTAGIFTADEALSTAWRTLYAIWANARTFSGATLPKQPAPGSGRRDHAHPRQRDLILRASPSGRAARKGCTTVPRSWTTRSPTRWMPPARAPAGCAGRRDW